MEWIYCPQNTEELKYFIESLRYFHQIFQRREESSCWRPLFEYLGKHDLTQGLTFKKALKCSVLIGLILQYDQFEKLATLEVAPGTILAFTLVVLSTMAKKEELDSVFFPQKLQDCSRRLGISWDDMEDHSERNLLKEACRGARNQTKRILQGLGIFEPQVEKFLPDPELKSPDDYLFS